MRRTKALFNDSLSISLCQLLAVQTLTQSNALSYQPLQWSLGSSENVKTREESHGVPRNDLLWSSTTSTTITSWQRSNFYTSSCCLIGCRIGWRERQGIGGRWEVIDWRLNCDFFYYFLIILGLIPKRIGSVERKRGDRGAVRSDWLEVKLWFFLLLPDYFRVDSKKNWIGGEKERG